MSRAELEREFAVAEQLKRLHPTWKNAASEYRRALRRERPVSSSARCPSSNQHATVERQVSVLSLPPPELTMLAQALSVAIAKVGDGRHGLYLALGGALLTRGVDPKVLPALVARIAQGAGDAKVRERVSDAVSTARARERGAHVTGFLTLRMEWPHVAAALDAQLPMPPSAAHHLVTAALRTHTPATTLPLATAVPHLRAMLAHVLRSPNTSTVLQVSPGVGKSREALESAINLDIRAAFVHPTNAVASEQYRLGSRLEPGAALRRFGVLAVLEPDGSPVCKMADIARVIQAGGMPVPQRLCMRCPHREGCTARDGKEGANAARIAILNQSMMDAALDHVGVGDAIVLDELPPVALHTDVTDKDLDTVLRCLRSGAFSWVFSTPATPMIELLRIAEGLSNHGESLMESLARAAASLIDPRALSNQLLVAGAAFCREPDETAIDLDLDRVDLPRPVVPPDFNGALHEHAVEMFAAAFRQWPRHSVPPTSRRTSRLLASSGSAAGEIATASRVLAVLGRLVNWPREVAPAPIAAWEVSENDDGKHEVVLAITEPNRVLQQCLAHPGPVAILDATPDIPALMKLSPKPVDVHALDVIDGAPVFRRIIASFRGSKRYLAPSGRIDWDSFAPLLCEALLVAGASVTGNLLIVTHRPCADALRSAFVSGIPHARLARMLQLRSPDARLAVSHFGNVKGRNDFDGLGWSDLHIVITIGDPWPDIRLLKRENVMLRLTVEQAAERGADRTAAELAQAHGRLRAPRQTKATCAVHVGAVVPMGWSLANATVHQLQDGRPKLPSAMDVADLCAYITRAGGFRPLARAIGCSDSTIRRYFGGRPIPVEFANELRRLYGDIPRILALAEPEYAVVANDIDAC